MTRRREHLTRGNCEPFGELAPGIVGRAFVSGKIGALDLSTGTVTVTPEAVLPYHTHEYSEALTILEGEFTVAVEGRRYRLRKFDCIHVPGGVLHTAANLSAKPVLAHWAFPTPQPTRAFEKVEFKTIERGLGSPEKGEPEHVARFDKAEVYALADGTEFRDLFARRFGSKGICGGYGEFASGTGLPCHTHKFDESITIVGGRATCQVAGRSYSLADCDTAMVPTGLPHRFLNESNERMAMVWVYAGDEPERALVDTGYCLGTLKSPITT